MNRLSNQVDPKTLALLGEGGPPQWWVRDTTQTNHYSKKPSQTTIPSSGLTATFSLMEKGKITQRFWQWSTSKNQQTSVRCNTDPKTLARFGRGGPAALVGEGHHTNQPLLKKTKPNHNPRIQPYGHFLPTEKIKKLADFSENPRPFWERGDQQRWWVRDTQFVAPHPT